MNSDRTLRDSGFQKPSSKVVHGSFWRELPTGLFGCGFLPSHLRLMKAKNTSIMQSGTCLKQLECNQSWMLGMLTTDPVHGPGRWLINIWHWFTEGQRQISYSQPPCQVLIAGCSLTSFSSLTNLSSQRFQPARTLCPSLCCSVKTQSGDHWKSLAN